MTQFWTVYETATRRVIEPCFATASQGSHPKDNGLPGWDSARMTATRISRPPDPAIQVFDGAAWVEDPARIEQLLVATTKAAAEEQKMRFLSPGGAKKTEYADKRAEVLDWDTLGGTAAAILSAFNALPPAARALRFAHAIADAAAFGDTPADAIARFRLGALRATAAATISAIEARTCALIKAAPTAAAKRAAAAVTWPA